MQAADLQRTLDAGFGVVNADAASPSVTTAKGLDPADPVDAHVLDLLQRVVHERAQVVHLCPEPQALVVRARVDATLRPVPHPISAEDGATVLERIATLAQLPEPEGPAVDDGSLSLETGRGPLQVGVTRAPYRDGYELILRLVLETHARSLDALGMDPDTLACVRGLTQINDGLIVLAGPGRSGRSTLLRAILGSIDGRRRGVGLVEHNTHGDGLDLRAVSRFGGDWPAAVQAATAIDADVIGLDRTPDAETWAAAAEAVDRGRLVIATLNAQDSAAAIDGLVGYGLDRPRVATLLRGVVASRVLPRLCPSCRTRQPDGQWHAPGCQTCAGTGTADSLALYEIALLTAEVASAVAHAASTEQLRQMLSAQGMRPLAEAAASLAHAGELSAPAVRAQFPFVPSR